MYQRSDGNAKYKPISDLSNYTEVLKEVDAVSTLLSKLQNAEKRAAIEGWIDAEDLELELGGN